MPADGRVRSFRNQDLLPAAWRRSGPAEAVLAFNPCITRWGDAILMAYRLVLPDRRRRIALCRLDPGTLEVLPGSCLALSDHLEDCGSWHADPRFCVFGQRLLLHFNNGMGEPGHGGNRIYLVELDPATLLPLGPPQALALEGVRQKREKNWMLFEHGGELLAVYRIEPQVILRIQLSASGPLRCQAIHQVYWDASGYARRHGEPRGGTPPVRLGDAYFSFFHSRYPVLTWRGLLRRVLGGHGLRSWNYVGGFYGFSAEPPFAPLQFSRRPVLTAPAPGGSPAARLDQGVHRCVYPCGAIRLGDRWVVSYGLQNQQCCLVSYAHAELLAGLSRCQEWPF